MAIEIERKFLIKEKPFSIAKRSLKINQGYIINEKSKVIRVREKGDDYFLTIKGNNIGISRLEYDFPISKEDAKELIFHFCKTTLIEKTRHYIEHKGHTWEVDEFHGKNNGLIVAEIELESEDEKFEIPDWVGEEVTQDDRYYNMNLAIHPFTSW
jgi:adenylate cyclase|tara:strand:- start:1303 stop:1767 length:465 start_codon:yes stop_codon:yes gene_type:complete